MILCYLLLLFLLVCMSMYYCILFLYSTWWSILIIMIMMIMTIIIIFHFTDLDHMEYIYYYNHNYIHNYIPYLFLSDVALSPATKRLWAFTQTSWAPSHKGCQKTIVGYLILPDSWLIVNDSEHWRKQCIIPSPYY